MTSPVPPGGTVGILGGGQLGRMLAMAAAQLGLRAHVYCDNRDASASQVCDAHTVGKFEDMLKVAEFAAGCDVVTFEFENVPAATIDNLADTVPVNPGAMALRITQDRFEEKCFIQSLGLATPRFAKIDSAEEARASFADFGSRAVLKTRRFGYDGKGQAKASNAADAVAAFESFQRTPTIIEAFIPFEFEASVIAARSMDGAFAAFDPPENHHADHILRRSTVPGRLTQAQAEEAKAIARKIADALDYLGVLAVELFVLRDGSLMVNEIAPRVHNSGHWTIEACAVSQFEQHIRAVCGWPLGDPARHADAVMENIIGDEADAWESYANRAGALHLYGKGEARPGRKMGHFTTLSPLTKR
ncbi:MAG TPA: 5-(carboxyamino)imidazole ribonucleotide synthase [Rhizomicrobium sp.]|nr:5-(carboxyamino)imidazole ribonucleotide synthase [Rhizomicrobium sp.]